MSTRIARTILRLAEYINHSPNPSRTEVRSRIAAIMSDMEVLRRARMVTETDFHSAFSSTPMAEIQKIYDGPIFSGDRPTMKDLWSQFTYALNQVQDESPEKDPEYPEWISQLRSLVDGLGL